MKTPWEIGYEISSQYYGGGRNNNARMELEGAIARAIEAERARVATLETALQGLLDDVVDRDSQYNASVIAARTALQAAQP
jgi:hypothetical protein